MQPFVVVLLIALVLVSGAALSLLAKIRRALLALSDLLSEPALPPVVNVAAPVVHLPAPVVHVQAPIVNLPAPVVHVGSSRSAPEHPGAVELLSRENAVSSWESQGWARENSYVSREYYATPNKAFRDKGVLVEGIQ